MIVYFFGLVLFYFFFRFSFKGGVGKCGLKIPVMSHCACYQWESPFLNTPWIPFFFYQLVLLVAAIFRLLLSGGSGRQILGFRAWGGGGAPCVVSGLSRQWGGGPSFKGVDLEGGGGSKGQTRRMAVCVGSRDTSPPTGLSMQTKAEALKSTVGLILN
jgi:hypothetical protein